jgi:hypothetical protein
MIAARPLAGAHTWLQSIGGFALGAAFVAALRHRVGRIGESRSAARTAAERE